MVNESRTGLLKECETSKVQTVVCAPTIVLVLLNWPEVGVGHTHTRTQLDSQINPCMNVITITLYEMEKNRMTTASSCLNHASP